MEVLKVINIKDSSIDQILPSNLANTPEVQAIGYAIKKANQRFWDMLKRTMVYANIDALPEKILDVLAIELRSPYYEPDMEIEKKREIVKNTLYMYSKAGTPQAVEEMVKYVFGSGEVVEWFENNGEPGTFTINTTSQSTAESFEKFAKTIKKVKNVRSHLVDVKFGIRTDGQSQTAIGMVMAKTTRIGG